MLADLIEPSDAIVDVGGGRGTLLAGILDRAPGSRGVLYDSEQSAADAPSVLDAAGRVVGAPDDSAMSALADRTAADPLFV